MTSIAGECLNETLELEGFFGPDGACPAFVEPGRSDRLVVVTGGNAEGKSVLCRMLERTIVRGGHAKEVMRIGMGIRTASGMVKGLMFGNEGTESTGKTSVRVMSTTFSTSRNRDAPHWIVLDEPDIGIGEAYHQAIGELVVRFAQDWPKHLQGLVVVSHARRLIAPIVEAGATSIRMGRGVSPIAEWLRDGDPSASVEELLALGEKARETHRRVDAAANALKELERSSSATSGNRF